MGTRRVLAVLVAARAGLAHTVERSPPGLGLEGSLPEEPVGLDGTPFIVVWSHER